MPDQIDSPSASTPEMTSADGKSVEKLSLLSRISLALGAPAFKLPWITLLFILIVTAALAPFAVRIQNDDDVIKFLPQEDPQVVKFMEIGDQFHGLQMAIVGFEANTQKDIFNPNDLMFIRLASRELKTLMCADKNDPSKQTACVSNTTSFTEISDIGHSTRESGEEEASVNDLVPDIPFPGTPEASSPQTAQMLAEVRDHALTLDHVRGFLLSPDARAAAVYAQVNDAHVSTMEAAQKIKEKLDEIRDRENVRSDANLYYGGSPFIGEYSAVTARADMGKLSPFVIGIVILIILLTSRSIAATGIALLSVAISMVWVFGGMELAGIKMTLVATSLPILLVALGSAYAIHLITAMMSQIDKGIARKEAMRKALILTGPPIIVCVLTTAAGFFSFLTMDVEPMTEFGGSMGLATLVIMLVTFWFVTSCCLILPIKPREGGRAPKWAQNIMRSAADTIYRKSIPAAVGVAVIALVCAYFTTKVEPHGDNSSLFAPGSVPVVADDFMNNNFGGSNFIQTQVIGDLKSPLVMRQIERTTAAINADPRIAGMQSISDVVVIVGGTMGDGEHIPASNTLLTTLESLAYADDASVAMMADAEWKSSLMQIRVKGKDVSQAAIVSDETDAATRFLYEPRIRVPRSALDDAAIEIEKKETIQHLQWIFTKYGKNPTDEDVRKAVFDAKSVLTLDDIKSVVLIHLFDENDALIYMNEEKKSSDALSEEIFAAMQSNTFTRDWFAAIVSESAEDGELDNKAAYDKSIDFIMIQFDDAGIAKLRKTRAANLFELVGEKTPSAKFRQLIESAVWGLGDTDAFLPKNQVSPEVLAAATETQSFEVIPSGYPGIYRAMNASVIRNQIWSLAASFLMVFICLLLFTRSPIIALVSLIPASMTVLLTFGTMGALNIGMDVGSSMIAAISLSVGIDYACHLIWKFGRPGKDKDAQQMASNHMLRTTGWGIIINALEVGLGLSVLYFGELLPMRNFGLLTGLAMIVSAAASLLLLPALLRWATKFIQREAPVDEYTDEDKAGTSAA